MAFLYLTADTINQASGGGLVTNHESEALQEFAKQRDEPFVAVDRNKLEPLLDNTMSEPWHWDDCTVKLLTAKDCPRFKLCHVYAGTFSKSVKLLKERGCVVAYSVVAHDRHISKLEHEKLGFNFPYRHLVEDALWQRYIECYRLSDVILCPGTVPAKSVREYGGDFTTKRIEIIPHGCDFPEIVSPPKKQPWVLGCAGAVSPDKGSAYLFAAWKALEYKDAVLLWAGAACTHPVVKEYYYQRIGGGNVVFAGWHNNISDFYNSINCYVQPSATEGFSLEVLEAQAHGRPVICSTAAGAVDLVPEQCRVEPCDIKALADKIHEAKTSWNLTAMGLENHVKAENFTWDRIRQRYVDLWSSLV